MKAEEPFARLRKESTATVLFAASQLFGGRVVQEDYFVNFRDECFVVADGVSSVPHGDVASRLAAETAAWAYKVVRRRQFYWHDKKLFLKRIFRSSNLTVWQKQREKGFESGLATTLLVGIVGPKNVWIGSVGDSSAILYRQGAVRVLTREEVDQSGRLTNVVGVKRLGLVPQIISERFDINDCLLLATDGVTRYVKNKDLLEAFAATGQSNESIKKAVLSLLGVAKKNKSQDNMTACIIKRVAIDTPGSSRL